MSAQSFDSFICTVADCLDPAVATARIIAFDDHAPGVVMLPIGELKPPVQAEIDNLLAARPRGIALCVRTENAWLITAVCPEFPARFAIKIDGQPLLELCTDTAPLAMLESVSRLRWALDGLAPWQVPSMGR